MSTWSIEQSKALYNIQCWSEGYFDINSTGEMCLGTASSPAPLSLYQLVKTLQDKGLSLPLLLRFPHILQDRVQRLHQAFEQAMRSEQYHADYIPVYPIKVNQQHQVIDAILHSGKTGLEAGSKPELLAVLSLAKTGSIVICNGYKDSAYIRLALIAQGMGIQTHLVIEKASELKLIIQEAKKLGIRPLLGVRVKLASTAKGKWQDSGGDKSKFGLNASQILAIVEVIKAAGLVDCLQLMHFHIGSQIPNIRDIQKGLYEAGRYYAELRSLGMPIGLVDVGGGLGIDYEGLRSRRSCSINYDIQEYANNVIHEFKEVCLKYDLPQPDIITETGRAITAHHAVLITDIIDAEMISHETEPAKAQDPEIIRDLWGQLNHLNKDNATEAYHNATYWLSEIHFMFAHGLINLKQRAHAEQLYYAICSQVRDLLKNHAHARIYRELFDDLNEKLSDKYFANFSLFRSVPDAWAIDQLFPIMPLQRLDEYPERRATLQDLTCDSDGQFKQYISENGIDANLPVHPLNDGEAYLMGVFLIGAYQEILGDMHNLFGEVNSVNIHFREDGQYELKKVIQGDSVSDVLNAVNFNTKHVLNIYQQKLNDSQLDADTQAYYLHILESGLESATYLNLNTQTHPREDI